MATLWDTMPSLLGTVVAGGLLIGLTSAMFKDDRPHWHYDAPPANQNRPWHYDVEPVHQKAFNVLGSVW